METFSAALSMASGGKGIETVLSNLPCVALVTMVNSTHLGFWKTWTSSMVAFARFKLGCTQDSLGWFLWNKRGLAYSMAGTPDYANRPGAAGGSF